MMQIKLYTEPERFSGRKENNMLKGMSLEDLKFYYQDNVNVNEYPTFIHWMIALREQVEY